MPYTRLWNDATPAGTRAAKEIDDAIREFKVDVHDRMNTLVDDWTTDPIVLQAIYSGAQTDRQILFGPHILQPVNDEDDISYGDGFVTINEEASARAAIPIPIGYTIKLVECWMDKGSAATTSLDVRVVNVTTGAVTALGIQVTNSGVGVQLLTTAALSHVMTNTAYLQVKVNGFNGSPINVYSIYGFRVTVDRTDNSLSY